MNIYPKTAIRHNATNQSTHLNRFKGGFHFPFSGRVKPGVCYHLVKLGRPSECSGRNCSLDVVTSASAWSRHRKMTSHLSHFQWYDVQLWVGVRPHFSRSGLTVVKEEAFIFVRDSYKFSLAACHRHREEVHWVVFFQGMCVDGEEWRTLKSLRCSGRQRAWLPSQSHDEFEWNENAKFTIASFYCFKSSKVQQFNMLPFSNWNLLSNRQGTVGFPMLEGVIDGYGSSSEDFVQGTRGFWQNWNQDVMKTFELREELLRHSGKIFFSVLEFVIYHVF